MPYALRALLGLLLEFGPLLAFWIANACFGLFAGIAASVAIAITSAVIRYLRHEKLGRIFWFSLGMTIVFGAADLLLRQPIFLRYEAVVSNVVVAIFIGSAAFGPKPIIMEFAERSGRLPKQHPPDLVAYFRVFTLLWAAYFLAKAVFYVWVARNLSLTGGMLLRLIVGQGSFYLLLGFSIFFGRPFYFFLRWTGLVGLAHRAWPPPAPAPDPAPATPSPTAP
jgi:intracellular septation protein A